MVGSAKCSGLYFAELTTPSAPLRWLRDFLLLAQPPLLFKEGKRAHYHYHFERGHDHEQN